MKAAVFYGKEDLRLEHVDVRQPGPQEIMVKVEACGICGTDVHIYRGEEGAAKTPPGTVLGHEFSGTVYETGPGVEDLAAGDRVCIDPNDTCGSCYYCRKGMAHFCENMTGIGTTVHGGFAEYCTVPAKQVYRIAEDLTFAEAAMAEPLACCLHGIDMTEVRPGGTVMVIGGGTVGLIMVQLAALRGASHILLVEPVERKRLTGKNLGADICLDPRQDDIRRVLESRGIQSVEAVIECVGKVETMKTALQHAGRGGTVMLFGLTAPNDSFDFFPFDMFKREVTVKTSFINPYTQGRAVSLLDAKKIAVQELISDEIPLSDIERVFTRGEYAGQGKIIIRP